MHVLACHRCSFISCSGWHWVSATQKWPSRPADYDKLQAENTDLKVQRNQPGSVNTCKLGEKLSNLESISAKIQTLIENDNLTQARQTERTGRRRFEGGFTTAELICRSSSNVKDGSRIAKGSGRPTMEEPACRCWNKSAVQRAQASVSIHPNIWPVGDDYQPLWQSLRSIQRGRRDCTWAWTFPLIYNTPDPRPGRRRCHLFTRAQGGLRQSDRSSIMATASPLAMATSRPIRLCHESTESEARADVIGLGWNDRPNHCAAPPLRSAAE